MKNLLPAVSFLVLSAPIAIGLRAAQDPGHAVQKPRAAEAQPQAGQGLDARVAALEGELAAERKRHDETRARLDQVVEYLDKQAKAAQAHLAVIDQSQAEGFAVGENWQSRETLLAGWRAYWGGAATGLPKAPEPTAQKPALPARPVRK